MGALSKINHVVVLMLENRSFDCLLGKLYPKSATFDGLAGNETNPDLGGNSVPVWNSADADKASMSIPNPDPGEFWVDMNMQLFGTPTLPRPLPVPSMSGFVRNYQNQRDKPAASYVARSVMHFFTPEQVPVISQLARQFAVCDRWHASAPCQTWPNRFFVHTATANGYENNDPPHTPYEMPTIFNRLEERGTSWKVYFHDMPQSLTLSKLWPHADHFRLYPEFIADAKLGHLPAYSFVEPRYFTDITLPNDMHPPHVVTLGEQLIAEVYNALRAGPKWTETLLIITYDEHGGCYDHVPPPSAMPPSPRPTSPFNFDRYGVRVPAIIASPYVRQGTILRPSGDVPFDHTSIIATLRKRFSLGASLTARDAVAPDLDLVLALELPSNLGPERVEALPYAPSPTEVAQAQTEPLNHHQKALVKLAGLLPSEGADGDFTAFIESHIARLRAGLQPTGIEAVQNSADAVAVIKSRLGTLFRSL